MAATLTNGRPHQRRQLGDQLDRLDSILDGLSDALNESVAEAAREGVKGAVKEAVIELLVSPELRDALHKATSPQGQAKPSFWQRLRAKCCRLTDKVSESAKNAMASVACTAVATKASLQVMAAKTIDLWRLKKVLLVGLGVGLAVTAISYVSSHGVSAVVSGAGAAATTVAVHTGLWVRKTLRRLSLA